MIAIFLIFMIFCCSCGSSSLQDYKEIGRTKVEKLLEELQKIRNRDQLIDAKERLAVCFREIVEILIEAEQLKKETLNEELAKFTKQDLELSERIRLEMIRIYRMEGGREILEKIQKDGLKQ